MTETVRMAVAAIAAGQPPALAARLRRVLRSELSDAAGPAALDRFEAAPDDSVRAAALIDEIARCARDNPDFDAELVRIMKAPVESETPALPLWIAEAAIVLALAVTAVVRLLSDDYESAFGPGVDVVLTVIAVGTGIAAVVASARLRHGWTAVGLLICANASLSPYPVLHVLAGVFVVVELVRALLRRGRSSV